MYDVIFARPRWDYDSYSDLYKLIRLSGYPLIFFDEIDPQSDNCYIMTMVNGENQNGWTDAKARIILYDLEWRLEGEYPRIPGVSEIWSGDKWYADKIGAKYVPVGSHPDLPDEPLQDCYKQWDAAMLSYMTNRRLSAAHAMMGCGINLAPNGWGMSRHETLLRTRIILHVHQHDFAATVAPQRWALAAAYRMPIISEPVNDMGIFGHSHMMQCECQHMPTFLKMWRVDHRLTDYANALHELLCVEKTFRKCIEAAL